MQVAVCNADHKLQDISESQTPSPTPCDSCGTQPASGCLLEGPAANPKLLPSLERPPWRGSTGLSFHVSFTDVDPGAQRGLVGGLTEPTQVSVPWGKANATCVPE